MLKWGFDMRIFLDAAVVFIFIATVYYSYRKGLVRSLIEFFGFALSFLVSLALSNPLGRWIGNTFFLNFAQKQAQAYVSSAIGSAVNDPVKFFANAGNMVKQILSGLGINIDVLQSQQGLGSLLSQLQGGGTDIAGKLAGTQAAKNIVNTIAATIAFDIGRCIAFVLLFAVCSVLVGIFARMSNVVFHIPVLGTVNALGGAAIGIFKAVIFLFIFSFFVMIFESFSSFQKNPIINQKIIDQTYIYKYVQNVNPLTKLLLKK